MGKIYKNDSYDGELISFGGQFFGVDNGTLEVPDEDVEKYETTLAYFGFLPLKDEKTSKKKAAPAEPVVEPTLEPEAIVEPTPEAAPAVTE